MSSNSNLYGFFYRNEKGLNCKIFKSKMKYEMTMESTPNVEWSFVTDETIENALKQAKGIAENVFRENLDKAESC